MKTIKIVSKQENPQPSHVFDIEVDTDHHYILDGGVVSHNSGPIYASSIVLAMRKLKLKEDELGNKVTDVRGIRAQCKVMKTRYNKPFESVEIKIPYDRGMDPHSGLFDLFSKKELLVKEGNKWIYTALDGTQIKKFEKAWDRNEDGCLEQVMEEFEQVMINRSSKASSSQDDVPNESESVQEE
jgi:hypothetical protein